MAEKTFQEQKAATVGESGVHGRKKEQAALAEEWSTSTQFPNIWLLCHEDLFAQPPVDLADYKEIRIASVGKTHISFK